MKTKKNKIKIFRWSIEWFSKNKNADLTILNLPFTLAEMSVLENEGAVECPIEISKFRIDQPRLAGGGYGIVARWALVDADQVELNKLIVYDDHHRRINGVETTPCP